MKYIFGILLGLWLAAPIFAQTNAPVRLALIAESEDAAQAVDVLTAQLTSDSQVQLLERDQIDRVYHEQETAAANRDDVKLGRILGADGLVLLEVVRSPSATNLTMRLVAVKPGVVLTDGSVPWPLTNTMEWSGAAAGYLQTFFPKLTVLAQDAIPISVVNLSSAIQSADALETERDLKLLAIQRLSQEPQFFVLERQKMQMLSDEKNLKSDETPFWDGSYLLDGTIDQNGYSRDTITIDARLRPPRGGAPLLFEVQGSRTNLADVVDSLAIKVASLLKISTGIRQWDAASEASQYFNEANWALKWGVFSEAEAAGDSAWALGKHDLECATVRVKAYTSDVSSHLQTYGTLESSFSPGFDASGKPITPPPSEAVVRQDIAENSDQHLRTLYAVHEVQNGTKVINYLFVDKPPDAENAVRALRALELYYDFSRTSPDGQPKIDSEWYRLGLEDLEAASKVLQNFNFLPESQKPVADKLADLRTLARSVAALMSQSPSIHDGYFVGDRLADHDELSPTIEESPSIFRCEVNWGCLWQERPEDTISLYRELMSSPVFCYIHNDFWIRTLAQPRLVAWDDEDAARLPGVWDSFMQDLKGSTNVRLNMEALAIRAADATNDMELGIAVTNLFNGILQNRDAFVTNNVEVSYADWGTDHLVEYMEGGFESDTRDALRRLFYSRFRPEMEAMDDEYWRKTIPARKTSLAFEKQKQYLASFTPYDFWTYTKLFSEADYTKAQAAELLPLVVAYESNMVATATDPKKFFAKSDAHWIALTLEKPIKQILNLSPPVVHRPPLQDTSQSGNPVLAAKLAKFDSVSGVFPSAVPVATNAPEIVTNFLIVDKALEIPVERIVTLGSSEFIDTNSPVSITAHHWFEGKLLLDVDYELTVDTMNSGQIWNTRTKSGPAITIFDPATGDWDVIACGEKDVTTQNNYYDRSVLIGNHLLNCDRGQIRSYDFATRQWQALKISDGNNYELITINGRLYAANGSIIFEITDDGQGTRILASTRRRPALSALDSMDNLGTPFLFAGPGDSLKALVGNGIYSWDQNGWHEESELPDVNFRAEAFKNGLLFHGSAGRGADMNELFRLEKGAASPELCLWENFHYMNDGRTYTLVQKTNSPAPIWRMPGGFAFGSLPGALDESNLFLLAEYFGPQTNMSGGRYTARFVNFSQELPGDTARLLSFSPELPRPFQMFLKFDGNGVCSPLLGVNPRELQIFPFASRTWMLPEANSLFFGREDPRGYFPGATVNAKGKAGVWLLPYSQLEPALAAAKQSLVAKIAQEKADQEKQMAELQAARENIRRQLLAKYDRNHNGIIDPDEREEALDDPAFIESELDNIDANHDGRLEANELAWFDANQNKILDPKEAAGINIAQHLLAIRVIKTFDADGKGYLSQSEFSDLKFSCMSVNEKAVYGRLFAGPNYGPAVGVPEVEGFLNEQTVKSLGLPGSVAAMMHHFRAPVVTMDKTQIFKMEVEYYWAHLEAYTN